MDFDEFRVAVRQLTGIDLLSYKQRQMKRRIDSLMQRHGINDYQKYYDILRSNQERLSEFVDRLTINVSEFFRNAVRWKVLEERILPKLFETKQSLSIWSAACSTGEEPYTLTIILAEKGWLNRTTIVATDIDERALEQAQQAVYDARAVKEVPQRLLDKYFHLHNGKYVFDGQLKQHVKFHKHDLLRDPYPASDLIICRNVMIYFTEEAKDRIYRKFNEALSPGGVLFVGSTEQIFHSKKLGFDSLESFFYIKK